MDSYITKLPKELLALIFEHLTKANDRRRAAQVCKLFYDIIRHQSTLKRDNMLRVKGSDSAEKSPIRLFEKSEWFPFSKLCINNWHRHIILESAFWSLHGHKLSELIIDEAVATNEILLSKLSDYFPSLKKLTIKPILSNSSDVVRISQPTSLSIEDLTIDAWTMSLDKILNLLRCSPWLKNLEITSNISSDHLPQILPWLENIECSRLRFGEIPLEKLINLPSKAIIEKFTIKLNETPELIREFFKRPRTIDLVILRRLGYNDYRMGITYFTRDQVMALGAAKSIKDVRLPYGPLEFEDSLDLLARLPGLETISIKFMGDLPNPLYPFYWSSPETAQKICDVVINDVSQLHYLAGLSSLTSISILSCGYPTHRGLSNDEIQFLIRNCPNLKTLKVPRIDATDADLIGHGNLLPFSSLEKLESLSFGVALKITPEAFMSAFKFPNLKSFVLHNYNSSEEQPFNQDVAKHFTQNCPNLEYLTIYNCPIIDFSTFDFLIRHLPYLRRIEIKLMHKRHSLSKVGELKRAFP